MSAPRKITLKDGTVKYRIVFDFGFEPVGDDTGKPVVDESGKPKLRRKQKTMTFDLKRQAQAELDRIGHERATGTYVPPSKLTLNALLDGYLASATFEREAATRSNYGHALRVPRERLGERLVQSITREDIEALRDYMLTSARKRGGRPGTALGPRSVRLAIGRLSAAFEQAVNDGKVTRNPCRRVRMPSLGASSKGSWSEHEARQFLTTARHDRLRVAWEMALRGAGREEICGARWTDIDLEAKTWTISVVRVVVDGKVIVKPAPKSERSARTLLLDDALFVALTALHKQQAAEKLAAGPAYQDSGYVIADELGQAVNPEWLSKHAFQRIQARSGVRRITLHEARHTASTLMEKAGVPDSIRAAWCGHTVEVNKTTYVHTLPSDVIVARDVLTGIYKIGEGA